MLKTKKMSKSLATWVVLWAANILAFWWFWYFGTTEWVLKTDMTYISAFIVVLYIAVMAWLPYEFSGYKSKREIYEKPYYIANHFPALGLLGTVIGLMYAVTVMMNIEINVSDQSTIVDMMSKMFSALGTSLITTIVGIIFSLVLKTELLILDTVYKNE